MAVGKPPNLRESSSPTRRCATCVHFNPAGHGSCRKWQASPGVDYPVDEDDVCDSYEAKARSAGHLDPPRSSRRYL